jgi:hypothetical protein
MVTIMHLTRRVLLAGAAMLALTGAGTGVAITGTASAATPSCGSTCRSYFLEKWGSDNVLDVYQRTAKAGTPIILYQASNNDPAEDWTYVNQGTVAGFYGLGLVSAGVDLHYATDEAFELEYTPYGVASGLCMGTASSAGSQTPVALERCGVSDKTVWINDSTDAQNRYSPLISGSDTNFSTPYVLQYPGYGNPASRPRAQLNTYSRQEYTGGIVYDNQLWSYLTGPLNGAPGCTPAS